MESEAARRSCPPRLPSETSSGGTATPFSCSSTTRLLQVRASILLASCQQEEEDALLLLLSRSSSEQGMLLDYQLRQHSIIMNKCGTALLLVCIDDSMNCATLPLRMHRLVRLAMTSALLCSVYPP